MKILSLMAFLQSLCFYLDDVVWSEYAVLGPCALQGRHAKFWLLTDHVTDPVKGSMNNGCQIDSWDLRYVL
jgi:hypothetical protein